MIEIVYSKEINKKDEYLRLPRNIKQTGIVEEHKKVYIEDYVDTFMGQFLDDVRESRGILVLTGKAVYNSGCNYTFVEGCVWAKGIEIVGREIFFSEKIWMDIHKQIKEFYPMVDIVGWAIVSRDELIGVNDAIVKIHKDNFPGKEKILITREVLEKEQIIYNMENGIMREHRGYYTYYEKNPQMQAYMINIKENIEKTEKWEDKATKSFRNIIREKEDVKKKRIKRNTRMMKIASTFLLVLLGSFTYYNFDELKVLQKDLELLTNSVNQQSIREWFADASEEISDNVENLEEITKSTSEEVVVNSENVIKENDNIQKADNTKNLENEEKVKEDTSEKADVEKENSTTLEVKKIDGNVEKQEEDTNTSGQVETDASEEVVETQETVSGMVTEIASTESEITGNVEPEVQEEPKEPKTYVIQKGDSLEKIAIKLYGNIDNVSKICELNNITDVNKIFIGQEIIIP